MNPGREECRINVPLGASKSIDTKSEFTKYAMSQRFVPEQSGTPGGLQRRELEAPSFDFM